MDESTNGPLATRDQTRLRRLNINLLYALNALLHSPSLTAAAHSIALSQPALSAKLRQLREHFKDELVIYGTGGASRRWARRCRTVSAACCARWTTPST